MGKRILICTILFILGIIVGIAFSYFIRNIDDEQATTSEPQTSANQTTEQELENTDGYVSPYVEESFVKLDEFSKDSAEEIRETMDRFIVALQKSDAETIKIMAGAMPEYNYDIPSLDFISDITFEKAEVTDTRLMMNGQNYRIEYDVALTVKSVGEKTSGIPFSVGDSKWVLVGAEGMNSCIQAFCSVEKWQDVQKFLDSEVNEKLNFCEDFSVKMPESVGFSSFTDIKDVINLNDEQQKAGIISALTNLLYIDMYSYMSDSEMEEYNNGITVAEVRGMSESRYGVPEELFDGYKNDELLERQYLGGEYGYCIETDRELHGESLKTVLTVDYYADPMFINVAKTMKYTIRSSMGLGGYVLISQECMYDSGYPAYITIV